MFVMAAVCLPAPTAPVPVLPPVVPGTVPVVPVSALPAGLGPE